MKHSSIWSCLMIFSVVGISLLTSCGRSGKVEITPYILNLHLKYTHIDNFEHGIARVSMILRLSRVARQLSMVVLTRGARR